MVVCIKCIAAKMLHIPQKKFVPDLPTKNFYLSQKQYGQAIQRTTRIR